MVKLKRGIKGFTLIEVILSSAVLVIVGSALFGLAITAITGSGWASTRSIATQYAKEGTEGVRSFRDLNGWLSVASLNGVYCLSRTGTDNHFVLTLRSIDSSLCNITGTGLTRTIAISPSNPPDSSPRKFIINVGYTENGQPRNVVLVTYLSDWK